MSISGALRFYKGEEGRSMSLSSHGANPPAEVHVSCRHIRQGFLFGTKFTLSTIFSVFDGASILLIS